MRPVPASSYAAAASRVQIFPVNPTRFEWEPYWEEMNSGLLQFVLKEDILERRAKFAQQRMYGAASGLAHGNAAGV